MVERRLRSAALQKEQLSVDFVIECEPSRLKIPEQKPPHRQDGLWLTTCGELFIRGSDEAYWEFNFSPSGEWAAYTFERYRERIGDLDLDKPPFPSADAVGYGLLLGADLELQGLTRNHMSVAISAVIEETDGTKTYWALAHPEGKPDFHHPACFAGRLEPPEAA